MSDTIVSFDSQTVALVVGVVIPLVVGALTKMRAPDGLKAVLNLGLSALTALLSTAVVDGGEFLLKEFLTLLAMTWGTSIVSYYGLHKPTGLAGSVATATSGFGVGPKPSMETDEKGNESIGA
jgi:hypothetical protein